MLKILGGQEDDRGIPHAYVIRVKKGSVAEEIGHLEPGDEVISWNGYQLQGATADDVYKAILATKDETSVMITK